VSATDVNPLALPCSRNEVTSCYGFLTGITLPWPFACNCGLFASLVRIGIQLVGALKEDVVLICQGTISVQPAFAGSRRTIQLQIFHRSEPRKGFFLVVCSERHEGEGDEVCISSHRTPCMLHTSTCCCTCCLFRLPNCMNLLLSLLRAAILILDYGCQAGEGLGR
jgi:hypothetical protein